MDVIETIKFKSSRWYGHMRRTKDSKNKHRNNNLELEGRWPKKTWEAYIKGTTCDRGC